MIDFKCGYFSLVVFIREKYRCKRFEFVNFNEEGVSVYGCFLKFVIIYFRVTVFFLFAIFCNKHKINFAN